MRKFFPFRAMAVLVLVLVWASALPSNGQMYTPVCITAGSVICDEYGNVLSGSASIPASKRSLVQVYWASNSVIHPPGYSGLPHPNNAPVEGGAGAISIGHLISPALLKPGRFVSVLANPRPPQNSRLFVRVFNAPTIERASFYADSQVLRVRGNDVLVAEIGDTINPLDPRDDDGDGLNNSWEKSLGTDPYNWDTDGDGISDYDEFLAGTDPHDRNSFFAAVGIEPRDNGGVVLTWISAPGRKYIVERLDPTDPGQSDYEAVSGIVSSQDYRMQSTVTNSVAGDRAMFRVRLVIGD